MTRLAGLVFACSALASLPAFLFLRRMISRLPVMFLMLGAVLVPIGGWLVTGQSRDLTTTRLYSRWPTTTGIVLVSRVVGTRAYHPHIEYEYEVAGATYRDSSTLDLPSIGGRRSAYDAASWVVEQYPVGRTVTVHYNPLEPSQSGLRVFPSWAAYGKLSVGVTLLVIGLALVLCYLFPHWPLARASSV